MEVEKKRFDQLEAELKAQLDQQKRESDDLVKEMEKQVQFTPASMDFMGPTISIC